MPKTAILIDGGFYRKRAKYLWGPKTAEGRAKELEAYCRAHLSRKDSGVERQLYRIFYYDCAPVGRRSIYHPLTMRNVDLDKSDTYTWASAFLDELKRRRKFALRCIMASHSTRNEGPSCLRPIAKGYSKRSLTPYFQSSESPKKRLH